MFYPLGTFFKCDGSKCVEMHFSCGEGYLVISLFDCVEILTKGLLFREPTFRKTLDLEKKEEDVFVWSTEGDKSFFITFEFYHLANKLLCYTSYLCPGKGLLLAQPGARCPHPNPSLNDRYLNFPHQQPAD